MQETSRPESRGGKGRGAKAKCRRRRGTVAKHGRKRNTGKKEQGLRRPGSPDRAASSREGRGGSSSRSARQPCHLPVRIVRGRAPARACCPSPAHVSRRPQLEGARQTPPPLSAQAPAPADPPLWRRRMAASAARASHPMRAARLWAPALPRHPPPHTRGGSGPLRRHCPSRTSHQSKITHSRTVCGLQHLAAKSARKIRLVSVVAPARI